MVNARKVFLNIAFQHITAFSWECLKAIQGSMCALFFSRGVWIVNKDRVKYRLQHIVQRMMNYSIPIRCCTYHALLWLIDSKVMIWSRLILLCSQLFMQTPKFVFQIIVKAWRDRLISLSTLGKLRCLKKIGKWNNFIIEILVTSHMRCLWDFSQPPICIPTSFIFFNATS